MNTCSWQLKAKLNHNWPQHLVRRNADPAIIILKGPTSEATNQPSQKRMLGIDRTSTRHNIMSHDRVSHDIRMISGSYPDIIRGTAAGYEAAD